MNIIPLDQFDSDRQFEAHYRSLPRVILEGRSDAQFFSAWFENLGSDLDFVPSEDINGGAGSTAVADAVRQSHDDDDIPAIGIVDRDWLHRDQKWDMLYSLDDAVVATAMEQDDVFTACFWEIEAYLLRPELMGRWVALQRNPPPASPAEKDQALTKALEECEALLDAMPYFAAAHVDGKACKPKHFSDKHHHEMPATCAAEKEKLAGAPLAAHEEVEALIAAIRAAAPTDPTARFLFLIRFVDTKRLLQRLGIRLGLHDDAHHALSELMSMTDVRPREFEALLIAAVKRFGG